MSTNSPTFAMLLVVGFSMGCASGRSGESLATRVSRLVDATTASIRAQEKALAEIEELGLPAAPYLIGHLGDRRPLAKQDLNLRNNSPNAFEGQRHYSPKTVHDALAAVLNQVTGRSFVFVYNGATDEERVINRRQWVEWCQEAFPAEAEICRGGPRMP